MSRELALGHSGASQNVGNQLRPGMSSVKLHAPPGGASSISLAWGAEPAEPVGRAGGRRAAPSMAAPTAPAPSVYAAPAPPSATIEAHYAPAPSVYEAAAPAVRAPAAYGFGGEPPAASAPSRASGSVSSNAYASGANQNSGNFITDRPTTRVHAAPGGRSSIVLG